MTRFSIFTNKELDEMDSAFCSEGVKDLVEEVRAERRLREWTEMEKYALRDKLDRLNKNSNYEIRSSWHDDGNLAALCIISKQLKEIQDALVKANDKI